MRKASHSAPNPTYTVTLRQAFGKRLLAATKAGKKRSKYDVYSEVIMPSIPPSIVAAQQQRRVEGC